MSSSSAGLRVTANGRPASDAALRTGPAGAKSGSSAAAPKKKMIIKPFKVQPQLPDNFEDSTWEKLRAAVHAVQHSEPVATSKEELYRAVEDLCAHRMAARLYERLSAVCDAHIGARAAALAAPTPDTHAFLTRVASTWADHCEHMLTIRNIFLYLDRTHVLPNPALHGLWDLGLHLFRVHLAAAPGVETRLVSGLLAMIEREREGEDVSRELLCALLRMQTALGVYSELFEGPFLAETGDYYAAEGTRYMGQADVPHFLRHVEVSSSSSSRHQGCTMTWQ
jgi:cullin 4